MKLKIFLFIAFAVYTLYSCEKMDHETKEFYKNEVYIAFSESTSAAERQAMGANIYNYIDTFKILNEKYDRDTLFDQGDTIHLVFKVGTGGSLTPNFPYKVKLGFDQEMVNDYNTVNLTDLYIPDKSKFTTNADYNEADNTFEVTVHPDEASSVLYIHIPAKRKQKDEIQKYAFPLKVLSNDANLPISRKFDSFFVGKMSLGIRYTTDWSGFPIPELPLGRYFSTACAANSAENTAPGKDGEAYVRSSKFILKLSDKPEHKGMYLICGNASWAWEQHGFLSGTGWMYNLVVQDENTGTFHLYPILDASGKGVVPAHPDLIFPYRTFDYNSVQQPTDGNVFDMTAKKFFLHYKNVIGRDVYDVLTFIDNDFELDPGNRGTAVSPTHWGAFRDKGYKYWLPSDEPEDSKYYAP
ncbi:hypothetical protein EMN47_05200 [Prolixibacteraceae bacterium JC049]|nr:hypothetical protein [Prolixibacteraceae bacterium JC049]